MNKSTPLNRLPTTIPQPAMGGFGSDAPAFVNDEQKHMVTQAQQAVQDFPLPQNTSIDASKELENQPSDNETDETIQEVLNGLNQPYNDADDHQQQEPQEEEEEEGYDQEEGIDYPYEQRQDTLEQPVENNETPHPKMMTSLIGMFIKDVKLIVIACLAFLFAQFVPIEQIISIYPIFEKFPYSNFILRSLLSSILVYVCIKLLI